MNMYIYANDVCVWSMGAVRGWHGGICSTLSYARLAKPTWSLTTGLRTPSDD